MLASWALRVLNPCASNSEFGIDVSGGVQTEVPDFHEGTRQNVQEKPAHEFQGDKSTDFLVAGAEDDFVVIDVQKPVVRDGDPVGVQTEVAEKGVGFSKRRLCVDDPVLVVQGVLEPSEGAGFEEVDDGWMGARTGHKLAFIKQARKAIEEFAAKEFAKDLDWKQVFLGESTHAPLSLRPPPVTMQ